MKNCIVKVFIDDYVDGIKYKTIDSADEVKMYKYFKDGETFVGVVVNISLAKSPVNTYIQWIESKDDIYLSSNEKNQ